MPDAVNRRLHQELGLSGDMEFLFKFVYHAQYDETGAEHELCWVYLGRCAGDVVVNANEIADWRFVSVDALNRELTAEPSKFTPWLKLEWRRIQDEFPGALNTFASATKS